VKALVLIAIVLAPFAAYRQEVQQKSQWLCSHFHLGQAQETYFFADPRPPDLSVGTMRCERGFIVARWERQ
jgi:hypothetical protein